MKNILLAASEAVPLIKTGGLADVVGALPKNFDKAEYDVRVIIPKYLCIDKDQLAGFEKIGACEVTLNWRKQYAGVWRGSVEGITWYLIENEYYFAGKKPYGYIYTDAEKFAFFAKAVLTVLPSTGFRPDVIHCNDWQTALLPVFLKKQFDQEFYRYIKTIFTIHNMRFQGRWYMDAYKDITGLPGECFTTETMECYGQANPFKGGVVYSDFVTTVSKTYALEIQGTAGGEGLEGLMQTRSGELFGIVNGVDTEIFDPASNPALVQNYDADSWESAKKINKTALQKEVGLNEDPDVFLVGMVSRLTDQKGFDLVATQLDAMMREPKVQVVLQGTGEEKYENLFSFFAERYPGRIAAKIQYSDELAQRIYASSDAFLMPSMFEPCGISQLISLHYGTVPMVRETGGLKDTVHPYDQAQGSGNGFTFSSYNADDMLDMVWRAYGVYKNSREEWKALAKRGMAEDVSWKKSAGEYAGLYDVLCRMSSSEIRAEEMRRKEEEHLKEEQEKIREAIAKSAVKAPAPEENKKEIPENSAPAKGGKKKK